MKTYIVGHKNPDTDSIVSAILFANILGEGAEPARQGDINKETEYLLDKFGFEIPIILPTGSRNIVLVDHNSIEEGPSDLKPEEVVALYDHHKLGGPRTTELIPVRIEKVGCTATLASIIYGEKAIVPSTGLASIAIGAIISDTINLTSPTTTEYDREAITELNKVAKLDVDELAQAMFTAKSDISDISTEDLIGKDYKVFEMAGQKVGIGVWETVLPETVLDREDEIVKMLAKKKVEEALDCIFFVVVDILHNGCVFVLLGDREREVAEAAFKKSTNGNLMQCDGIVSRKKQITPQIETYLASKK